MLLWNGISTKPQLIKRQSCHHIETSQLICSANRLTGFYMIATLAFNELSLISSMLLLEFLIANLQHWGHAFSTYAKFPKRPNISYPLIRTYTCACQGARNVGFLENFAYALNEWIFTVSRIVRNEVLTF